MCYGQALSCGASSEIVLPFCHNLPMCGRYRLSRRKQIIEEHFGAISGEEDWSPRYNIAPTQPVAVIRQHPKEPIRELSLMCWGLTPRWAKDSSAAWFPNLVQCSQNVLPEATTRIRNPLHLHRWFHRLEELTHLTPAVSASAAGQRERIW